MAINPHNRFPNTPLIYEPPKKGEVCKNLLLIDAAVNDNKIFTTSVNSDTFPITYSYTSDRSELLTVLQSTFTTIDRIGIVSEGGNTRFLNMKSFFDNAQFLIYVIKEFGVKNIDFLACSSLNNPEWVNFYTMLNTETAGVVVGASNDETGNIKYGGNWVMESTSQDIEFVYFTEVIEYYQYLLAPVLINGLKYNLFNGPPNVATVVGYDNLNPPTNLVIPSTVLDGGISYNVTTIGQAVFNGCPTLTGITIPGTLTTIGEYAFYYCTNLTQFTVNNNPNFYAYSGVLFSGTANSKPSTLIQYPIGKTENTYTIPSNVTTIGVGAFAKSTILNSVTIPNSVTTIAPKAFYNCTSLTSVVVPNSVTTIGGTAVGTGVFDGCTSLASVTIGTGVINIGTDTFARCTILTCITIPSTVTIIGDGAFYECDSLTSVTIGAGVTTIVDFAFYGCTSLASVTIPSTVISIGESAFSNCTSLSTYNFIGNPPTLGNSAFANGPTPTAAKVYYYTSYTWPLMYGGLVTVGISPTLPAPPTNILAIPISGLPQATVSWVPPVDNGGYPVTSYTVTSSPATSSQTINTSPLVFTGLSFGTFYTFRVVATTGEGVSGISVPSGSIISRYNMRDMF